MIDINELIISQYQHSPSLVQICQEIITGLDVDLPAQQFFDNYLNLDTCNDYGLDIWGRIVGIDRVLQVTQNYPTFGFYIDGVAEQPWKPWNYGVFYAGTTTAGVDANTELYRRLVKAKALANNLDGSTASINFALSLLFKGRGEAYVIDNQDMTITYHFGFTLTTEDQAILGIAGILPRPAGVKDNIMQDLPRSQIFGFYIDGVAEQPYRPFNFGVFVP